MSDTSHGKANLHYDKSFSSFAETAASMTGSPIAFVFAIIAILMWVISGPFFDYSSEWKMVIGVVPSIITFLLVFLIQNSQNRETRALQIKLNELIRATEGAHTTMLNLEKMTEQELQKVSEEYERLAQEARRRLAEGQSDQDVPDMPIFNAIRKVSTSSDNEWFLIQ